MKWILSAAEFVRRFRHQLRFGEQSRAPLKLLRLELREDLAECEWLARASDAFDAHLSREIREQGITFQALRDAISVCELLFCVIPEIQRAALKVYRQTEWESRELIIEGTVNREDGPPRRIASLFMQARLCGLRFNVSDGVLESLGSEENDLQLINR